MIMEFVSLSARSDFVMRVKTQAPEILARIKPSFSKPTVVTLAPSASAKVIDIVKTLAGQDATLFDDAKLDVMEENLDVPRAIG